MNLKHAAWVGLFAAAVALATAFFGFRPCGPEPPLAKIPNAPPRPRLTGGGGPGRLQGAIAVPAAGNTEPSSRETLSPQGNDTGDPIAGEVAALARELELDQGTADAIAELTRRSFYALVEEVRALEEHAVDARPDVDELLHRRSLELHDRIEKLLAPDKVARYRALVGR